MIRNVQVHDAEDICNIYNYYIQNSVVTFEEDIITIDQMIERIQKISSKYPYIAYELDGQVVGYAYASTWRTRSAYRYCVESTVYVHRDYMSRGIGSKLYEELIRSLGKLEIHNIMGVIALPNPQSVKLHEKLGFYKAGHFKEVGRKFDKWIDIGYWQYDFNK
ncbi:MAG: GNAT family N-acetyltransferase [Vallitalea sp.]|jgi:phosphinothricin acetyltransferase|nr:GNAT family N-acetyltransferase [Vallitalea sp.]